MREEEVSISFATDAPGADVSADKSLLTVVLTPPLAIDPMAKPTVELSTMRFINQFFNVSAALGNNVFHTRWALQPSPYGVTGAYASAGGTFVPVTIPDGNYSLQQLQEAMNAGIMAQTGWPAGIPPITLVHLPSVNRIQLQAHVGNGGAYDFIRFGDMTRTSDIAFALLLGFVDDGTLGPAIADTTNGTASVIGNRAPTIDLVNAIRVELDVATGNYAPPEATSDGQSRGHSDAIAFIPIQAAPGHQQVYMPADAPQAGVHVGMTERLTIKLKDQAGRNLPSDEHWSGMLTFRGLTPHAR